MPLRVFHLERPFFRTEIATSFVKGGLGWIYITAEISKKRLQNKQDGVFFFTLPQINPNCGGGVSKGS